MKGDVTAAARGCILLRKLLRQEEAQGEGMAGGGGGRQLTPELARDG